MRRARVRPLFDMVVDQDDRPVAGATVSGKYAALVSRIDLSKTTGGDGRFEAQRAPAPLLLQATAPDGRSAGITKVGVQISAVTIRIGPTATVHGTLFDENGAVLAGAEVRCRIRVDHEGDDTSEYAFGSGAITDPSGQYRLPRLVLDVKYEITYVKDPDDRVLATVAAIAPALATVTPERAEVIELGEMRIPRLRRATVDERITSLLGSEATASESIARALAEAVRERTRVLLVFGDLGSAAVRALLELLHDDAEIRRHAWNYERVAINTSDAAAVAEAAARYNIEIDGRALPVLVVLNGERTPVAKHAFVGKAEPDQDAVLKFLMDDAPELSDAEELLAAALGRARKENERVLVQYSASWCGPCRRLPRFIDRHRDLFDREYIHVKIDVDRSPQGRESMERHRPDGGRSIPWVAILDAEGTTLATDGPGGNIGFPAGPEGGDHFVSMLKRTAVRLSDDDLKTLRRALQ